MSVMASQIISLTIVHPTVYSGIDQRRHQSSVSLAFVRGIHWWLVNSLHKGPVTWKMVPFDDIIMWQIGTLKLPVVQAMTSCHLLDFLIITLILQLLKPNQSMRSRSVIWLLMPWILVLPGHHLPRYWAYRMTGSLSWGRISTTYTMSVSNKTSVIISSIDGPVQPPPGREDSHKQNSVSMATDLKTCYTQILIQSVMPYKWHLQTEHT